jgi:hypothetical protein
MMGPLAKRWEGIMHIHQLPPELLYQPLPKAAAKPKSEELEELRRAVEEDSPYRVNALKRDEQKKSGNERSGPQSGGSDQSNGAKPHAPVAKAKGRLDVLA